MLGAVRGRIARDKRLGGALGVVDACEEFFFTPAASTQGGAHIRQRGNIQSHFAILFIALLPCILLNIYRAGGHYIAAFVINIAAVMLTTVASAVALKRKPSPGGWYLGALFSIVFPFLALPVWCAIPAAIFAVFIGQEIFGGTGRNIWHPALILWGFLYLSYPDRVGYIFPEKIFWPFQAAVLIGSVWLLINRRLNLRILAGTLLGAMVAGIAFALFKSPSGGFAAGCLQPLMGDLLFGTVFIACDPVTSCQSPQGKWIYGASIGILAVSLRALAPGCGDGTYPAILLMNTFAPLIDKAVISTTAWYRNKHAHR